MRRRHSRLDFKGSIHFVTTVTLERGNWFVSSDVCLPILEIFEYYRNRYSLKCYGYVLMPDHIHCLFEQINDGAAVPGFMKMFKRVSAKQIQIPEYRGAHLWQERYDDVPVPGRDAAMTKLKYMLNNPVRRELVSDPVDYLWSSARDHYGVTKGTVTISDF
ncbi:hypothetical protein EH220_07765 [bacterium]|nr:MAG: hypothetical protein EH220_07765 [bacterium]